LCEPALAGAVRARLGIHGRPPGGRPHPGRALVSALIGDRGPPGAGLPVLFMTQWRRIEALTSEPGPFICRVSRTAMTPIALD